MTNSIVQYIGGNKKRINGFHNAFQAACAVWGYEYRACFIKVAGEVTFGI
ncbi:hypothetical protein [Mucilaginibacter defluvii]